MKTPLNASDIEFIRPFHCVPCPVAVLRHRAEDAFREREPPLDGLREGLPDILKLLNRLLQALPVQKRYSIQ